jgi:hypothetical protein
MTASRPQSHQVRSRNRQVCGPGSISGTTLGRVTGTNRGDFQSQAGAQAVLRADPRDPNRLDADRDGIGWENNRAPYDRVPIAR